MKSFFSALLDWDFFFLGILAERRQLNWRRILLLKSHYSVNVFNIKKRPKLAKISPMSDFMVNRSYFFIFVTWISLIICLNFGWYSRKWWQKKLKLWWYSWKAKKKWNHRGGIRRGGRSSALRADDPARRNPLGGFNLFYFCLPWNHQSFNFSAHIFVKPPKIPIIINETRSQKKNEWFPIKTSFFVIFGLKNGLWDLQKTKKVSLGPQKLVLQAQFEIKKVFCYVKKALCSS